MLPAGVVAEAYEQIGILERVADCSKNLKGTNVSRLKKAAGLLKAAIMSLYLETQEKEETAERKEIAELKAELSAMNVEECIRKRDEAIRDSYRRLKEDAKKSMGTRVEEALKNEREDMEDRMKLYDSLRIEHAALKDEMWDLQAQNKELLGKLERGPTSIDLPRPE